MKRTLLLKVVLLSFLVFSSCQEEFICERGNGPIESRVLDIGAFNGIEVANEIKVFVKYGAVQSVEVRAQENVFDLLNQKIKNGIWEIKLRHCVKKKEDVVVVITTPTLKSLSISGSGGITLEDILREESIKLGISGSGKIAGQIDAAKITTKISGSGKVELAGRSDESILEISGSGEFQGFELLSKSSRITISGSGKARIFVEEALTVNISGSGNVKYKGTPSIVNSKITGSGKIEKVD